MQYTRDPVSLSGLRLARLLSYWRDCCPIGEIVVLLSLALMRWLVYIAHWREGGVGLCLVPPCVSDTLQYFTCFSMDCYCWLPNLLLWFISGDAQSGS